jgi:hypothetical protein
MNCSSHNHKILFVCKKRVDAYGISFGLLNSARMLVRMFDKIGINASVVTPDDANGIDREVWNNKPTHVVIHALWVTPAKMEELVRKYPKITWNVRIHSKPPFLAMEGIASEWIAGYKKVQDSNPNLILSANSDEMNECLTDVFLLRSFMLPNYYVPPERLESSGRMWNGRLDVGCFGAVRPLKNHYAQAVAAIIYADSIGADLSFHVNKGREEQGGDRVVKNLRNMFAATSSHVLVEHEWYPHDVFVYKVAPLMDIGMQVSLTETFNIVAADMVSAGVPTIGSKDIYWMSSLFHADPNSVDDMVRAMRRAVMAGRLGVVWNSILLSRSNRETERIWLRYLAATGKK